MIPVDFDALIRSARDRSRALAPDELEEQARNFAAGNVGIEDPRVTREVVDRAVDAHRRSRRQR